MVSQRRAESICKLELILVMRLVRNP
jgi:hypothetical protein